MNNPLWVFSLHLYEQPGVAEACLAAQDLCGADVNLLLYAAWLSNNGLNLPAEQWTALEARVAEWRQRVVTPLRKLRRDWRALPGAERLREQVKALELAAEQAQQAAMWAWHEQHAQCVPVARPAAELTAVLARLLPSGKLAPAARDALQQRLARLLAGPGVA